MGQYKFPLRTYMRSGNVLIWPLGAVYLFVNFAHPSLVPPCVEILGRLTLHNQKETN